MDEKTREKALREFEQLKKMDAKDAAEVLRGYHIQLIKCISDNLEKVSEITNLSPNMIALTDTAFIIGEKDCFDKDGEIKLLAIVGSDKQVANIVDEIFKQSPSVFEEICKKHGLAVEKSA